MSILAKSPDLTKIIRKAVNRIGENHALARDHKGLEIKASEMKETEIIEEALKAVADEMAEKMVLENTIGGMVKDAVKEMGGGSGFKDNQGTSSTLDKFNKRQEVGEGEECGAGMYWCNKSEKCMPKEEKTIDESTTDVIKKLVSKKLKEAKKDPGIQEYERAHKTSGTESKKYLQDTKKKFKEYETFEGNTNPEFPHQEDSKTDPDNIGYQYYRNNDEDQEFIDDFAHPGLADFDINNLNIEKLTDYLEGSSETGNAQEDEDGELLGNVGYKSNLGEKIKKSAERRKEKIATQKASMTNLKGITPDVQKVLQVKEGVKTDVNSMKII